MKTEKNKHSFTKNQRGQSLVEFVLLFLVTVIVSFSFLAYLNGYVVEIWQDIITTIAAPNSENIQFR